MKMKLVLLGIPLLLAAACGAAQSAGSGAANLGSYAPAPNGNAKTALQSGAASGAAISAPAQSAGSTASGGPALQIDTAVPPLPSAQHLELAATIEVQMAHGKFDSGLNSVLGIIGSEHGYLASSDAAGGNGGLGSGTFTFQVPADNYQETLDRLRGVGKVLGLHSSSKPHDAEYVDLQARLKSAQLQLDAFNALLARATSITDIITIEQQVGQVQQEIEQIQGQLNYLDSVTQYSTVSVVLSEKGAVPAPRPVPDQWGFGASFQQALHNLAAIANGGILVLGTLLPFLLVIGVLAFATRRRWLPAEVRQ